MAEDQNEHNEDNTKHAHQIKELVQININEQWEVDYWANRLGVTQRDIREAVKSVGDRSEDVKKYFLKAKH
jgi:hypothetical protein